MKLNTNIRLGHTPLKEFTNHENYNCKIITDSGEEYLIYANWLHNEHMDSWKNWHCEAGATRLLIDKDFGIYSGECKNDYLGNALTDFTVLEHTICKQDWCTGCTDDLIVAKHK
jgi:hypothetical protein